MSKKHVIEVQAPEGKIPVYDESTRTISFIDEDIKTRVRTVEDAFEVLEEEYPNWLNSAPYSVRKMYELQTVLRALNRGHNFSLTEGRVWYPWVRFYVQSKLPDSEKKNVIAKFTSEGERYYLLGGSDNYGGYAGLGCFYSYDVIFECHVFRYGYCRTCHGHDYPDIHLPYGFLLSLVEHGYPS